MISYDIETEPQDNPGLAAEVVPARVPPLRQWGQTQHPDYPEANKPIPERAPLHRGELPEHLGGDAQRQGEPVQAEPVWGSNLSFKPWILQ